MQFPVKNNLPHNGPTESEMWTFYATPMMESQATQELSDKSPYCLEF